MTFSRLACGMLATCLILPTLSGCAQMRGLPVLSNTPAARHDREMKLNFAKVHENEGNLPKAEETLRDLLAERPNDPEVKHRLGVILSRRGQTDEGMLLLLEAVAAHPRNVEMLNDLGYVYLMQGDYENSELLFQDALDVSPKNQRTLNNLALAVGYQGRFDESFTLFRQTMSEAEAMANVAFVHTQRGELDQAMERYSQALSHDPALRTAADGLVQVYSVRNKVHQAADNVHWANRSARSPQSGTGQPIQLTTGSEDAVPQNQ
jgi:Flp pilus assembly protein TadD